MESNALEKSTNVSVDSRFFARIISMIRRIVRIFDVVDRFLRKPFWFFLREKYFDFRLDMVEKQSIVKFSTYRDKCYASADVPDSKVPVLAEEDDAAFSPFLYCILFIDSVV